MGTFFHVPSLRQASVDLLTRFSRPLRSEFVAHSREEYSGPIMAQIYTGTSRKFLLIGALGDRNRY